jgi:hypothetical protein
VAKESDIIKEELAVVLGGQHIVTHFQITHHLEVRIEFTYESPARLRRARRGIPTGDNRGFSSVA